MSESESSSTSAAPSEGAGDRLVLCPYCGAAQRGGDRCHSCSGLFEPLSQLATQIAMGPWYIRDKANPFRPGCSYEVLTQMIKAGRVKPTTVVRGPTTKQFWSIARNVEGISHLLGYCHSCHAHVQPTDASCESCGAIFKSIDKRDRLGLRFKSRAEAEKAQEDLSAMVEDAATGSPRTKAAKTKSTKAAASSISKPRTKPGLLEDALDMGDEAAAHDGQDGQTLDFAPSDEAAVAAVEAAEAEAGEKRSIGMLMITLWVLVALNILSIGGLAVLYVLTQGG